MSTYNETIFLRKVAYAAGGWQLVYSPAQSFNTSTSITKVLLSAFASASFTLDIWRTVPIKRTMSPQTGWNACERGSFCLLGGHM